VLRKLEIVMSHASPAVKPVLLIIDDDEQFQASLQRALRGIYRAQSALTPEEALGKLSPPPDVVLLDLRLSEADPDNREGLRLLETIHRHYPEIPIVMITGYPDIEIAVEAMRMGAVDFLQKANLKIGEIRARLNHALEHSRLSRRVTQLEQDLNLFEPRKIIGNSSAVLGIKRVIEGVARDGNVTVLISGETGTGKEMVARAIHANGWRQSGPFVPVMLNALPQAMLEAELFGYEPGAFTDARQRHIGYLEKAHGGVLFFDEIGDVDTNIQVKLLRFLEEREFQRLGSTRSIKVDTQVIAATNADLEKRIRDGQFREDLYFRLKVHEIVLPPIRQRPEDIPLLVDYFLQLLRQRGKRIQVIAPEALMILERFPWPGNVRQLKNTIESASFQAELHEHIRLELDDLPVNMRAKDAERMRLLIEKVTENGIDIYEEIARTELFYIEQALVATRGKKTEAWRLLKYNDRFALSRRVRRILEEYPHLKKEFPQIKERFEQK